MSQSSERVITGPWQQRRDAVRYRLVDLLAGLLRKISDGEVIAVEIRATMRDGSMREFRG